MLSEHFIASIDANTKTVNASHVKDVGIFQYELQPLAAQRGVFKKSATPQNCLAVTQTHIFAAQAEKAAIHVYNRERGNQEAIVPFPERITTITLAADDFILILGTAGGQVLVWEFCTGRLIACPQSHLQAVSSVAVNDGCTSLLSGSADSNVHVWSIPAILSFGAPDSGDGRNARSPVRTLSSHRGQITVLACGHGRHSTLAISAATDSSIIIWDYAKGDSLRTYLVNSIPRALVLDCLDRGFYTAYDDGSVQRVDFYAPGDRSSKNGLLNGHDAPKVIQPATSTRWKRPSDNPVGSTGNATLSLALSWDGSQLLSGHQDGKLALWDIATGKCQPSFAHLPGPVTNLVALPVSGLRQVAKPFQIPSIVKPRIGGFDGQHAEHAVPGAYTLTCIPSSQLASAPSSAAATFHFHTNTSRPNSNAGPMSQFAQALSHPSFPARQLSDALAELITWGHSAGPEVHRLQEDATEEAEYLPLEPTGITAEQQNALLQAQIEDLRRTQRASAKFVERLIEERRWMERDLVRLQRAVDGAESGAEAKGKAKGAGSGDGGENEDEGESGNGDGDAEMRDAEAGSVEDKGDGQSWRSSGSSDKG